MPEEFDRPYNNAGFYFSLQQLHLNTQWVVLKQLIYISDSIIIIIILILIFVILTLEIGIEENAIKRW